MNHLDPDATNGGRGDDATLDDRLRQALAAEATWDPTPTDASALGRVTQSIARRRQRRMAAAGGALAACVAVAAIVVATTSGPNAPLNRSAASSVSAAPSHRAASASAAGSKRIASSTGSPQLLFGAENGPLKAAAAGCALAKVGNAAPVCAGSFTSASSTTSGPPLAPQAPATTAPPPEAGNFSSGTTNGFAAEPAADDVQVKVGQHLTISLPASRSVAWSAPVVSASVPSSVPATAGPLRVDHSTRSTKTGGAETTFTALRPGTAILTAEGRCPRTGNGDAAQCAGGHASWTGVVQVTR